MNRWRRLIVLISLGSLGLFSTGCATHTGEGVVLGSLLGAGAGALIGHAAGDSGTGALIGAGSGAMIGGLIGNSYDAYDDGYARGRHEVHGPYPRHRPYVERREYHHHYHHEHYHYAPPPPARYHYYEERHYYSSPPRHFSFRYDRYHHRRRWR